MRYLDINPEMNDDNDFDIVIDADTIVEVRVAVEDTPETTHYDVVVVTNYGKRYTIFRAPKYNQAVNEMNDFLEKLKNGEEL